METVKQHIPEGLMAVIRHLSDPKVCLDLVAEAKWGTKGPECPKCASKRLSFLSTRMMWKCLDCQKQFSVKVGTIFEDSPIPLDKWLCAMWMVANCKNGVSSYEVARALEVSQKAAWFMLHRIRYAMHTGSINKMTGTVEADETFIGGKARNMHAGKRSRKGTGMIGKEAGRGLLERHDNAGKKGKKSTVRLKHVPNNKKKSVQA